MSARMDAGVFLKFVNDFNGINHLPSGTPMEQKLSHLTNLCKNIIQCMTALFHETNSLDAIARLDPVSMPAQIKSPLRKSRRVAERRNDDGFYGKTRGSGVLKPLTPMLTLVSNRYDLLRETETVTSQSEKEEEGNVEMTENVRVEERIVIEEESVEKEDELKEAVIERNETGNVREEKESDNDQKETEIVDDESGIMAMNVETEGEDVMIEKEKVQGGTNTSAKRKGRKHKRALSDEGDEALNQKLKRIEETRESEEDESAPMKGDEDVRAPVSGEPKQKDGDGANFQFPRHPGRIPPFVINDPRWSWKRLLKLLEEEMGLEKTKFRGEITGPNRITLKCWDTDTYRAIQETMKEKDIFCHGYELPADKMLKVVLRSLPKDTDPSEIQEELMNEGFTVREVRQMTKSEKGTKIPLPMFMVTLDRTEHSRQVYNLKYLMSLRIKVESYRGRKGPTQCHRCQEFFHAQRNCNLPPRCVKCGEGHLSKDCQNGRDVKAKCCNCGGEHTANYRGCEKFPVLATRHSAVQPAAIKSASVRRHVEGRVVVNRTLAQPREQRAPAWTTKKQWSATSAMRSGETQPTGSAESTVTDSSIGDLQKLVNEIKESVHFLKESGIIELAQMMKEGRSGPISVNKPTAHNG